MTPRVLILDDEKYRHEALETMLEGALTNHVWTVDAAILALQDPARWDLVLLDNDLGTEDWKRSGEEVARHIAQMDPAKRPFAVLIHSWNTDAAKRMYLTLKAAGYIPGKNLILREFGMFQLLPPQSGRIPVLLV
jgi:CheY-like chemotaxis protein